MRSLKGRLYETKCDLSPDGELFLYFAFQGSRLATSYTDAWTAVSRMPWLSALVLWPQGTTYGGGGRFVDNRTVALRGSGAPHPDHPLRGLTVDSQAHADLHVNGDEVPDADWSGRDQRGRVAFTRGHQLFVRSDDRDVCLADFSDLTPDPQAAPDWATRPL